MEGKKFVELLRKVIREEVRTVVKEELKAFKPAIVENTTKVSKTTTKSVPTQTKRLIAPPTPQFSGPLASILAETYEAMQKEPPVDDPEAAWPDMNGGVVTTNNMPGGMGASMASMMDNDFGSKLNQGSQQDLPPMMRDYSALLKKADDIANNKR